jgi:hypothetical protein
MHPQNAFLSFFSNLTLIRDQLKCSKYSKKRASWHSGTSIFTRAHFELELVFKWPSLQVCFRWINPPKCSSFQKHFLLLEDEHDWAELGFVTRRWSRKKMFFQKTKFWIKIIINKFESRSQVSGLSKIKLEVNHCRESVKLVVHVNFARNGRAKQNEALR